MKKINIFEMQCIVQLLFVWIIISVINAAPAINTVWHQHEGIVQSGLYGPTDHVVILNSTNLKNTIYGGENAWVVEFYANWCPHCQRFAAIWKTLAHSIDNWKDIVKIGVFDCATVENTPFCRDYMVMTVPTLKYFSPYSRPDELGQNIKKSEIVEVIRRRIIESLKNDENHNMCQWPDFAPLQDLRPNDVFAEQPTDIKYFFIIFENDDSYLGSTVILDFHNVSQISVQRVSSVNEKLCNAFKVMEFPTLIAVERENSLLNLKLSTPSRTAVYNAIKNYLKTKNIKLDVLDVIEDSEILEKYKPKKNMNKNNVIKLKNDDIYQIDLEKALHYSLEQEISLSQNITGEKLEALKNYLQVLAGYFPIKFDSPQYLKNIYDTVKNKTTIDGDEFRNLIALKNDSNQPQELEWIGCKGSLPHTRRYTCGLWTMFHTLTVQYAIATDKNHLNTDVGEKVILAIYGYAKYFFGCSHCAEHFVYMAEKNNVTEHRTADESVLWLWKAHNEVNLRLANDVTEDPEYPKIQYPSQKHCPVCRNANGTWNEPEVLNYLKEKYGGSRIKYDLTL
ncbi:hypothetical protein PV327_003253 [Microctonus hyperodae]|uniref:Sulfhydryl oxidase n=1 Tax=Microctonus hyperodae TaxID=165561 RepID=A0AA39L0Q1_MICHY|nr:hypothetical protein PV327_003253 [Microctonus hyperodae]